MTSNLVKISKKLSTLFRKSHDFLREIFGIFETFASNSISLSHLQSLTKVSKSQSLTYPNNPNNPNNPIPFFNSQLAEVTLNLRCSYTTSLFPCRFVALSRIRLSVKFFAEGGVRSGSRQGLAIISQLGFS